LCPHNRNDGLRKGDQRENIHIEHFLYFVPWLVFKKYLRAKTGIVDQNIDPRKILHGDPDQFFSVIRIR